MKNNIFYILFLCAFTAFGQKKDVPPTNEFMVVGQVETEVKYSITDLEKMESKPIENLVITNHSGEKRGAIKELKGIPIKTVLSSVKFKSDSPKTLSEFYFTFIASDGYKVVYSWNELYNTSTGDNVYLVTEKEGQKLKEMNDRILIVTTTDFKTGRRHIKGLSKIVVGRVE
jgi:hypothetical protein